MLIVGHICFNLPNQGEKGSTGGNWKREREREDLFVYILLLKKN